MKLLIYYFCALAFIWAGVNSFLVGLAYWGNARGAFAPFAGSFVLMLLGARFIVAVIRIYVPPEGESRRLED